MPTTAAPCSDPARRLPAGLVVAPMAGLVCILLLTGCAAVPPMELQVSLAPSEEAVITRTLSASGQFVTDVTFGERRARLILDTGASHCILDPDLLSDILGEPVTPGELHVVPQLRVGPVTARQALCLAHDMTDVAATMGRRIEGILGFPVFRDVLLDYDYPAGEVRVRLGEVPAVDGRWVLPLDPDRPRPYVTLAIADVSTPVLIDTGSSSGLSLRSIPHARLRSPLRQVNTVATIRGYEPRRAGRLDHDVRIGPMTLKNPIISQGGPTERPTPEGARRDAGLLGHEVLRHFTLTFDQRNHRVRLRSTRSVFRSAPIRSLGFSFVRERRGLRIIGVFPEGPAKEAGLAVGDIIVAVNGVSVHEQRERSVEKKREFLDLTIRTGQLTHEVRVPYAIIVE